MLKKTDVFIMSVFFSGGILFNLEVFANPALTPNDPGYVVDQKLEDTNSGIYDVLQNQIASQISQQTNVIRNMNVSVNAGLTGETGMGSKINTFSEQSFNNWTPTADDLAKMVQSGLQTGSLADQLKYYNEKFRIPVAEDSASTHMDNTMADYQVFSAVSTNAALSIADKGFSNAAALIKQINFLYTQIDQQKTLKESADLNSAILLKIAALQVDLIRLQSQQLKIQAVSQQKNNSENTFMAHFIKNVQ